jgi:hypothetical protein
LVIDRRAAIINAMATRGIKYAHILEKRAQEEMVIANE